MYEICSLKDRGLTIGEFKSILGEIYNLHQNRNDSLNHYCRILLTHYCTFFGMNDNDIIPVKQSQSADNDMINNVYYVQYPCERNEPLVLGQKHVCKQGEKCNILKKLKDQRRREFFLKNDAKMKNIEKHLRQFDHGQLLPFENCPFGINCKQFNNLCKSTTENADVKDIVHMHLFRHPSHHLITSGIKYTNLNKTTSGNYFEYISNSEFARPNLMRTALHRCFGYHYMYENSSENIMILVLMQEVINNDFEDNLKSIDDVKSTSLGTSENDFNSVLRQHKVNDIINLAHKKCIHNYKLFESMQSRIESINWDKVIKDLKKEYKILDILETKMNDKKHVAMGLPLKKHEMFAIILYTNTPCFNGLCEQLRSQVWNKNSRQPCSPKKWKCLDFCLYSAIDKLSDYETHDENIYTGLAGIYLDETKFDNEQNHHLLLKTYTSFSTDLGVAEGFATSNGLIIGINMKRAKQLPLWNNPNVPFDSSILNVPMQEQYVGLLCCDVSWISKFPTEREVLMAKHSILPISKKQIFEKGNCQYVISRSSRNQNMLSFEDMFCKYTKLN